MFQLNSGILVNEPFKSLIDYLEEHRYQKSTLIICIDGAGGSGKSTFAQTLASHLQIIGWSVATVHHDDFFLPSIQRIENQPKVIGSDFDWRRLRDQVILPLKENRLARYQCYDWGKDALTEWRTIPTVEIAIVEGVYTLRSELADLYDVKVWIECPRGIRLARGLARDGIEARAVWEQDWMPKEDDYIEAHRPNERADFQIDGSIH